MTALRYTTLILTASIFAAMPAHATAQDEKSADRERIEGMITKIEPLGEEGSGRYRLTINTGVPWRDYVRNVAEGEGEGTQPDSGSVAEGQPETESSVLHVEIGLKTPIQHRYRAEQDERSLGAASAEGALEISKEDIERTGPRKVPDGKQGKPIQPHFLDEDQFVIVAAKGEGDNPKVEWVIRLEPVRDTEDE